jgi:hypothetical protein
VFRFGKAKASRKERLRMKAKKAQHSAAETAHKAQAMAGPTVQKAGSAIAPKVIAARIKVTDDLMPLALAAMASAAERSRPARTEAKARSVAMWRALLGEYTAQEKSRKSHKVRNAALAIGGFSAAAVASLAATKRSRGPEWMQNGSEEPYATAAQPIGGAAAGNSSPQSTATTRRASSSSSASASRQPSDDKAGASPDEAIADKAEAAFDTDRQG